MYKPFINQKIMKMRSLLILLSLFFVFSLEAQTLPVQVLPQKAQTQLRDYALIPGGDFFKNVYLGSDSLQFQFPQQVSVDSFYISRYEVTVEEYVRFYHETGALSNLYDSAVWTRDFPYSFNEPMTRNYYRADAFKIFPAVGVTWDQALRFCAWKSAELNVLLGNTRYAVEFRLPTDAEWQYAAHGPIKETSDRPMPKQHAFPWGPHYLPEGNKEDAYILPCNSGRAVTPQGLTLFSYNSDGGLYTLPVKSYAPNGYGLYQMSGNVAEWTSDYYSVDYAKAEEAKLKFPDQAETVKRYTPIFPAGTYDDYKIVKGGSWADEPFYMQVGVQKIQHPEKASATVGFRPVLRVYRK